MATTISFNGSSYSIPSVGDSNWGDSLSNYLVAIPQGVLQKTGGAFTLSAEVDLGATYGIRLPYLRSKAANPALAGFLRLGNDQSISWRNQANSSDISLKVNTSDQLEYNSVQLADVSSAQTLTNKTMSGADNTFSNLAYSSFVLTNSIVNADINSSAAIAYSKLNLAGSITNADVATAAAIAYSKLNLTDSILNADINASAAIAYSKLSLTGSITNADIGASASIARSKLDFGSGLTNSDIASAAAIALSKLAAVTASRALVSDASGFVSASSVTATELGHLAGVTSGVQTQINSATSRLTSIETALPSGDDFLQLEELSSDPSTPSSGLKRIFAKNDDKLYQINDAGVVKELGAGGSGGGSGRLYFEDRDTADIGKFSLYADAAAATPVDGTGGAPNITKTLNTSTPLIGTSSYRLIKDAANRQGEGAAIETDLTLDRPVKAGESITVQFRYRTSANYVSGDIRMFYYLVGDNELYALNGMDSLGNYTNDLNKETGDRGQFTASLNATSSTTSIRIIAHIATTNALAYDVDFGEVTIGTAAQLVSVEKREQTISLAGSGSFTGGEIVVTKIGSDVIVNVSSTATFAANSAPASAAGLIPTWARPATNTTNTATIRSSHVTNFVILADGSISFVFRDWAGALVAVTSEAQGTISYSAPETGSNILSTTQAAFQGIKVTAAGNNGATLTANVTNINWTEVSDPFGAWNGSVFTAPKKARYRAVGSFRATAVVVNELVAYINGTATKLVALTADGRTRQLVWEGDLNALDQLSFRVNTNTQTLQNNTTLHWLEISEVPDLSVVGLAGQRREYLSATSGGVVTYSITAGTYGDLTSLALTPGVWRLDGAAHYEANGAVTTTNLLLGISSTSGNSATGLVEGDNWLFTTKRQTSTNYDPITLAPYVVTITEPTTYYLKSRANTSITNLRVAYKMSAERIA